VKFGCVYAVVETGARTERWWPTGGNDERGQKLAGSRFSRERRDAEERKRELQNK
jgi:hypothetical protein